MAISQVRAQINGTWYTLTLSSTGKYEATITPTAESSGQSGGYFNTTVDATSSTAGTVTVNGSTMPSLRLVVEDRTPPTLTVTSPSEGMTTVEDTITVTGAAVSQKGIKSVTVNGAAVTVGSGGVFSTTITLALGQNTITVVATDTAGIISTITRTVTKYTDVTPPELTVTNPAGDLVTNQPSLTVAGTAYDNESGLDWVAVNGQQVTVSGGSFSHNITLLEGRNIITVTAADRKGNVAAVTRSVLLDTQEPVITLISPPEGWINNNRPNVVFRASDEEGGSGVDMSTVELTLDGIRQTDGVSVIGTDITFTPAQAMAEGAHVITVTVRDLAGNARGLSATYRVDTAPPELRIEMPNEHRVVDTAIYTISGWASDVGSGVECVSANGVRASPDEDGRFFLDTPLEVGENNILVTVKDIAGNTVRENCYFIRLITDRTSADVSAVSAFYGRPVSEWTAEDLRRFDQAVTRGAYTETAMNRVGIAVRYIAGELEKRGYAPNVSPKTDWTSFDAPTRTQGETYRQNVETIRDTQGLADLNALPIPQTLRFLNWDGANQLEKALVEADAIFPNYRSWTSGEISCGE